MKQESANLRRLRPRSHAITTLTLQGHHALAEKVGGFLKQEQTALPTLIQWCHANGYGYYGEV